MVEGEPKQPDEQLRSEQVKQEILEYFAGEKLGSPKLSAFFDYCIRSSLEHQRNRDIDALVDVNSLETALRLRTESSLRITEMRLALLENKMEDYSSRIPGYENTLFDLDWMSQDLYSAHIDEIQTKYKAADDKQKISMLGDRVEMALSDIRGELRRQLEQ